MTIGLMQKSIENMYFKNTYQTIMTAILRKTNNLIIVMTHTFYVSLCLLVFVEYDIKSLHGV